jgi:histone deacetylase 6
MFGHMLSLLSPLAGGKVVVALEGGYELESLSAGMLCCASVLLGDLMPAPEGLVRSISKSGSDAIADTLATHAGTLSPLLKWLKK